MDRRDPEYPKWTQERYEEVKRQFLADEITVDLFRGHLYALGYRSNGLKTEVSLALLDKFAAARTTKNRPRTG